MKTKLFSLLLIFVSSVKMNGQNHFQYNGLINANDTLMAPVKKQTKEYSRGKKKITVKYYPDGKKMSKSSRKVTAENKVKIVTKSWDENGKLYRYTRSKKSKYLRGSDGVIWTFWENGKIRIRRQQQHLK